MSDIDAFVGQLVRASIKPTQARRFAAPLLVAMAQFQINSGARKAAFIGQCAHESALFTELEEDLWYRSVVQIRKEWPIRVQSIMQAQHLINNPQALANVVYANRMGNGDTASGDGWKYRGRGLIQITGHGNYVQAQNTLKRPYLDTPDLVGMPDDACLTAACFWHENGLNAFADVWAIDRITHSINPSMDGKDQRRQLTEQALQALSATAPGAAP